MGRSARRLIQIAVVLTTLGGGVPLAAQVATSAGPATPAAMSTQLSGAASQDWLKTRESVFMGAGGCSSGERWRFVAPGTLTIRRCSNGQWTVSQHRWRLAMDPVGKTVLLIDPYLPESGRRILFSDDGKTAVLRSMPSSKPGAFVDTRLMMAPGAPPAF